MEIRRNAAATASTAWALAAGAAVLLTGPAGAPAQDAGAGEAVPTELVVRAVAHDAKVIGSGVGGALITVRHAETGEILARGEQHGGTGSTELIVRKSRQRGSKTYDSEGAAAYRTTLGLTGPTRVEVTAEAPLGHPDAVHRATKSLVLLPGQDVTGEGLILELNGFIVEIRSPGAPEAPASAPVEVTTRVRMLCGCPTKPGGLWNSDRYRIVARLLRDGRIVDEADLEYAGRESTFRGSLDPDGAGAYELVVTAADPARANFGVDRRTVQVVPGG